MCNLRKYLTLLSSNLLNRYKTFILYLQVEYENDSLWEGKMCSLGRDPQVQPFDYNTWFYISYKPDNLGDFLLYHHSIMNFSIHIRQQACSEKVDWSGSCACAVAIQGGSDVFLIDACGSKNILIF